MFVGVAVAAPRGAAGAPQARDRRHAVAAVSVDSNRYGYWKVALDVFADHPVAGDGAGGFRVEWLQRRTVDESVVDAHSLVVETAAELGLVGLLFSRCLLGGVDRWPRAARTARTGGESPAPIGVAGGLVHALPARLGLGDAGGHAGGARAARAR